MRRPAAFLIAVIIIILQCQQVFAPVEDFYAPNTSFGGDWTNNPGNATGEPDDIVAWDLLDSNTGLYTYGFENLPLSGQINHIFIGIRSNFSAPGSGDDELTLKYSIDTFSWNNLDGSSYSGANLTNQSGALKSEYYPLGISLTWLEIAGMYLGAEGKTTGSPDSEIAGIDSIWLRVDYSDIEPPLISLMSPQDNDISTSRDIIFSYNVSDALSTIRNCSLVLNSTINTTNTSVSKGTTQYFSVYGLPDGDYIWGVNCTDNSSGLNVNSSVLRTLRVDSTGPEIMLESPIPNSEWNTTPRVNFTYNVSDAFAGVSSCFLMIDGEIYGDIDYSIDENTRLSIEREIENGEYSWSVNCSDTNGIMANSTARQLKVDVHYPNVTGAVVKSTVDLVVASTAEIKCNTSIEHMKGIGMISVVNATFYQGGYFPESPDDNNYHYTDGSCELLSASDTRANYSCSASVYYYAEPGDWKCAITATDINGLVGSAFQNFTINSLYGFGIYPNSINYSSLHVGENSSSDVNITITNYGNTEVDITLYGYGLVSGDGLAMNCTYGNIPVEKERFSLTPNTPYQNMNSLSASAVQIDSFNLAKQTEDNANSSRKVHWKMGIPFGVSGNCSGNIVIGAVQS